MVGIKHHTQGVGVNDATKQVSVTAWQEAHDAGAIADTLTDHNLAAHTSLGLATAGVPTGTILMYGKADAPTGYLLCDGQAYDKVGDYTALFNVIGILYGEPDIDHFNVPNLQLKFPLGLGAGKALGDTGGATTYTHAGVVVSDHAANAHNHGFGTIATGNESTHTHTYTQVPNHVHVENWPSGFTGSTSSFAQDTSTTGSAASNQSTANPTGGVASGTTNAGLAHNHSVSGSTGDASAALAHTVTSSGNDHTGVQPPYQVVNYIIKT